MSCTNTMQRSHSKHKSIFQWVKVLVKGNISKYSNVTATDWSSYKQNTKVYVSVTETNITEFSLLLGSSACSMSQSPAFSLQYKLSNHRWLVVSCTSHCIKPSQHVKSGKVGINDPTFKMECMSKGIWLITKRVKDGKKNPKNLLFSSWEELGSPAFYKAWVSGKPQEHQQYKQEEDI